MSNLKDTDFDDLFRRASEKFPLRTDSSDWDRMAAALEKDPSPAPDDSDESGDRRKRRIFWLFLLLPLAGIGYVTWRAAGRTGERQGNTAVVAKSPATESTGATPATATTPAGNSALAPAGSPASAPAPAPAAGPASASTSASTSAPASGPAAGPASASASAPASGPASAPAAGPASATGGAATTTKTPAGTDKSANTGNTASTGKAATTGTAGSPGRSTATGNTTSTDKATATTKAEVKDNPAIAARTATTVNAGTTAKAAAGLKVPADATRAPDGASSGPSSQSAASRAGAPAAHAPMSGATNTTIDPATNPIAAAFTLKQANIDAQRVRIADPYAVAVVVTAPETAKEPTKETKKQTKESKKQTNETSGDADKTKASPNQKTSYLYAGVIVAPDLSTVKMQHATGVGNTFGILLGYAFGPHWAVETGAYVERKRYYTDGEYFDIKKVRLPPNASLLNVDGTCYMWEIPLNVRYNFNPGGKTKWFATAGLSTYLMNRENYTYKYDYAGWGTSTWDSNWNIKKNSQYPFSIVGLSAGFEQRLGKLGNLRVEPYVRIPLGGIGTGSLPIMSTGINIGFTRRLW